MRLLDNSHRLTSRNVGLYFTRMEAERLKERLEWLLSHADEHFHLEDETGREISVSIYDDAVLRDPERKARYNKVERQMFEEP
jgi:hypothetical protein